MYRTDQEANVEFTTKLLRQADINISDIQVESNRIENPQGVPLLGGIVIAGQLIQPQEQYEIKITTGHTIEDGEGNERLYPLSLGEESLGTQQLFFLSPLLRQTLEAGKVLVVDEIDRSLHPFIVKYLVNLFRNPNVTSPSDSFFLISVFPLEPEGMGAPSIPSNLNSNCWDIVLDPSNVLATLKPPTEGISFVNVIESR